MLMVFQVKINFLESMQIWLDVTAPRFFWSEADTYRVGSTKQSESTMHTITKRLLKPEDFDPLINLEYLGYVNDFIRWFNAAEDKEEKQKFFYCIKAHLPEGFLQRRIWNINYKCFKNIYNQRINHKLPQWKYFCNAVLESLDHPEFIHA